MAYKRKPYSQTFARGAGRGAGYVLGGVVVGTAAMAGTAALEKHQSKTAANAAAGRLPREWRDQLFNDVSMVANLGLFPGGPSPWEGIIGVPESTAGKDSKLARKLLVVPGAIFVVGLVILALVDVGTGVYWAQHWDPENPVKAYQQIPHIILMVWGGVGLAVMAALFAFFFHKKSQWRGDDYQAINLGFAQQYWAVRQQLDASLRARQVDRYAAINTLWQETFLKEVPLETIKAWTTGDRPDIDLFREPDPGPFG